MPASSALLQEGRYRLDHPIVETGDCFVFNGYDTVRDTKVVVKEIVAGKAATPSQQENVKNSFVNQAKLLASIRHDALIQVEDYFSETDRQFLVLESVDGDDLGTLLEQSKLPFSLAEVAIWADQILDGLNYLHAFNPPVLHRRIRPENILKQFDGRVKLLAYSTADEELPISTSLATEESNSTEVLNYSPLESIWEGLDSASQKVIVSEYDDASERLLKSPADTRSDIYSLGATLYQLLTAKLPVDPLERSIEMLDGKPDPLRSPHQIDESIPKEVADAIMRAMAIKREDRFASAADMRQELRKAFKSVKEDADDEAKELAEAAEELRLAELARQKQIQELAEEKARELAEQKARELAEQKARELEEEKRKAAELLDKKLREAEELRLAAERRAAEAEKQLKEREAQKKAADEVAAAIHTSAAGPEADVLDENLLELTVEPNLAASAEPELELLEEPLVDLDAEPALPPVKAAAKVQQDSEDAIQGSAHQSSNTDSGFAFEEEQSGSKMPLIIGAVVLLVIVVVGGWVFLGSGSEATPVQTSPTSGPAVAQPAPDQSAPSQFTQSETAQPENSVPTGQPEQGAQPGTSESQQARTSAKPTPAKTVKPAAEPAKTPQKKKVTVDDLINDN